MAEALLGCAGSQCQTCNTQLPTRVGRGPKQRYCSDACRQAHYRRRRDGLAPSSAPLMPRAGVCKTAGCDSPIFARGVCSKHYHRERSAHSPNSPQACALCGATFNGRKRTYCSRNCSWTAADRRKGSIPLAEFKALVFSRACKTCPECGKVFTPSRHDGHSKGPQRLCSRECRSAELARVRAVQQDTILFKRWARAAKLRKLKREKLAAVEVKRCRDCGSVVTRKWLAHCEPCRAVRAEEAKRQARQRETFKAAKRAYKARRRAVERGTEADRFDPFETFERDGWKCHICGRSTPKRLRGTYDPRAPELDHIVPLALGGKHTRQNTACSCRRCNGEKGATPYGQLNLLAA